MDDRSTVLVDADTWPEQRHPGAASPPRYVERARTWPRTRNELDIALHGIGLALDELLDGATLPDTVVTSALPEAEAPSLYTRLRELLEDAEVDASTIEIIVDGERVTLRGRVADPLSRLLVEDLAWSLPTVSECDNRLAVV